MCKNIILIGMMGVGKTAVGRMLARELDYDFIDTDNELEKITGLKVKDIYNKYGKIRYNSEEGLLLKKLKDIEHTVLSTGGNTILSDINMDLLKNMGFIVHLGASADTIYNRIRRKNNRPLMPWEVSKDNITQMIAERKPLYQGISNMEINVDTGDLESVVKSIITQYQNTLQYV